MSSKATDQPSIGPTAIMPAVGPSCGSCLKANHVGVSQCVFCGTPFSSGETPTAKSGWTEGPESTPPTLAPPSERDSEPPPMSRKGSMLPSSGDDLAPPIADPLIGVVVAERYRIVEPLGRGGMGIVYKVEHTRIGKLLAMKLLTGELSRNPDVVRRFKQEALTVSKLSSPNTVQVFDFGAAEGLTYLVMELVAGDDLARILRTLGPMPFSRLGKILVQACSSLAEAHQKGIVHRDVKPENIMLLRSRDGADVAKVLDFGLAKLREGAELNDVTSQGAIVGTPYFMSPEQIRGEPVDPRTDIYALGALTYRALTGHYPFSGPTPMAVFTKHLTEPVIPPSARAPELDISPGVDRLVLRALAKGKEDRFQKIEELQTALVDEVRASGTSSIETLLDSGQVRSLAKVVAHADVQSAQAAAEIATRDEVERYERKLRRTRWVAYASVAAVVVAGSLGGFKIARDLHQPPAFNGFEFEPNNTAAEANPLPLGKAIKGHLGQRLDATHGDRDFYSFEVKANGSADRALVSLQVAPLPNFATCTMLYRQGLSSVLGQYCVGRANRPLSIPALHLAPGRYLLAEMQDLDSYGGAPVPLHENVSDLYSVLIEETQPVAGAEVEPNDQVASANPVAIGGSITGALGWAHDEDVLCVAAGATDAIRWKVRDVVRDAGAVLEVVPILGTSEGTPVRVHTRAGAATPTDVQSPWAGPPIPASPDQARCLRVRLTGDPWAGGPATVVPNGGSEAYVVEVEAVP